MLKEKNGMRWIDNVPVLIHEMQKDTALIGVFESVLVAINKKYEYHELMAISSIGLSTRWFKGEKTLWGGDSLPGSCNDALELISNAAGYDCVIKTGAENMKECGALLYESILNEVPVLCLDRGLNLSVAFGFEEESGSAIVRPYIDPGVAEANWDASIKCKIKDMPPHFVFLHRSEHKRDKLDAVLEGIKISGACFNRQSSPYQGDFYHKGTYYFGLEAYETWIADLEAYHTYSKEELEALKFYTWWNMICILDKRNAMISVFRNLAGNPYKTNAINQYVDAARLCVKQVRMLKEITGSISYNTSLKMWINDVSREAGVLDEVKKLDQEMSALVESIENMKDI